MTRPVLRFGHLDVTTAQEVRLLACTASQVDGTYPLSEHVMLHLRHGGDIPATHLLIRDDPAGGAGGALIGYAHVDTSDAVEGASAELVVHPAHRRQGLGRALLREVVAVADEQSETRRGRLRVWAHGDQPAAGALARSLGLRRWRVLWQMRRSLYAPMAKPVLPPGVRLRAFRPGTDDEAWMSLNGRAFADLPDQGRWTLADLRIRLAEPWFDPAGFLLAERQSDGALLGFHWTKVHGEAPGAPSPTGAVPHAHDPIGEVYVVGVAPEARGTGLGRALTLAGLWYLRERALDQAMLYVDEANTGAVALYRGLGFVPWSTDVCFLRSA